MRSLVTKVLFLSLLAVQACSVDVGKDDDKDEHSSDLENRDLKECENYDSEVQGHKAMCAGKNFGYIPNCEDGHCEEVPVTVTYDHGQKIEENRTIIVEAFRREDCLGLSEASAWSNRFNTDVADGVNTKLYLAPGIYYVRAYLSLPGETPKPRSYRKKVFKNDKPTGRYGAMSAVVQVIVHPDGTKEQNFIELYIDELYDEQAPADPEVASK